MVVWFAARAHTHRCTHTCVPSNCNGVVTARARGYTASSETKHFPIKFTRNFLEAKQHGMLSHHPIAAPVTLVLVVLLVLPQQTTAAPSFPTYTSQFNMTQEIWVAGTSRTSDNPPDGARGRSTPSVFSLGGSLLPSITAKRPFPPIT